MGPRKPDRGVGANDANTRPTKTPRLSLPYAGAQLTRATPAALDASMPRRAGLFDAGFWARAEAQPRRSLALHSPRFDQGKHVTPGESNDSKSNGKQRAQDVRRSDSSDDFESDGSSQFSDTETLILDNSDVEETKTDAKMECVTVTTTTVRRTSAGTTLDDAISLISSDEEAGASVSLQPEARVSLQPLFAMAKLRVVLADGRVVYKDQATYEKLQRLNFRAFFKAPAIARPQVKLPTTFKPAKWPSNVMVLREMFNPNDIAFPSTGPLGFCACDAPCRTHTCLNARNHVFCAANTCPFLGRCGNGIAELPCLQLAKRDDRVGLTVVAKGGIGRGQVIGQYLGELKIVSAPYSPASGYELMIKEQLPDRTRVVIDASTGGGITRFLNHSCNPSARFYEVRNKKRLTVVAATIRPVQPDQELTVDYGPDLWFICECGERTCRHRDIHKKLVIMAHQKIAFLSVASRIFPNVMLEDTIAQVFVFAGLNRQVFFSK